MAAKKKPSPEFGLQRLHLHVGIAVILLTLCLVFFPLQLIAVGVVFSFTAFFARGTALKRMPSTKPQAKVTANRKVTNISRSLPFF